MKRLVAGILTIGLSLGTTAFANEIIAPVAEPPELVQVMEMPAFFGFTGKVVEISTENRTALVENEEGGRFNFIFDDNTYFISGSESELAVGDEISGYYGSGTPMPMVEPPQTIMWAVAINYEGFPVYRVDRFDETGLSTGADLIDKLIINVSDETEIVWQDGTPFEGDWVGMPLVVYYTITTRSIPPQTPPDKIVVLFERNFEVAEGQPTDPDFVDEGSGTILIDDSGDVIFLQPEITEIVVEGNIIEAEQPFYNIDNILMVPLRAIAEALGFTPAWDNATKSVLLDDGRVSLSVDIDNYSNEHSTITLGAAPINNDGHIFVPLRFFSDVMGLNNAFAFEGQVVIDNAEKFE